jgi:hypothetical protein
VLGHAVDGSPQSIVVRSMIVVCAETAGAPAMTVSIIITAQALTGDSDCRPIVEVLFEDYPSFSGPAAIIVTKSNSEQRTT